MDVAAAIDSRDCSHLSCPHEADAGSDYCREHAHMATGATQTRHTFKCRVEGCGKDSAAQQGPWKGWCLEHRHEESLRRGEKRRANAAGRSSEPRVPKPAAKSAPPSPPAPAAPVAPQPAAERVEPSFAELGAAADQARARVLELRTQLLEAENHEREAHAALLAALEVRT